MYPLLRTFPMGLNFRFKLVFYNCTVSARVPTELTVLRGMPTCALGCQFLSLSSQLSKPSQWRLLPAHPADFGRRSLWCLLTPRTRYSRRQGNLRFSLYRSRWRKMSVLTPREEILLLTVSSLLESPARLQALRRTYTQATTTVPSGATSTILAWTSPSWTSKTALSAGRVRTTPSTPQTLLLLASGSSPPSSLPWPSWRRLRRPS